MLPVFNLIFLPKTILKIRFFNLKKMKVGFFLLKFFLFFSTISFVNAQDNLHENFKPYGKPIIKVYSNFHTSISKNINKSAMEIRRAYLGYKYFLNPEFEIIAKLDIGSPDDKSPYSLIKRYAYFKNAALIYRKGKLKASFGLIDLVQFKLQENFWAYRYIAKSFMDEHRFGTSADIGGQIEYKFSEYLSADVTIMNGEGYVRLQADNTYKGGFGVTAKPFRNIIARIYYDITHKGISASTLAGFVGYQLKDVFSVGCEYNYKMNDDLYNDHNLTGISIYGTYIINDKFRLFGRYDKLSSNILKDEKQPWNLPNDGSSVIGGIQYSPLKQINIALNYQDWYPYASNATNEAYIYLNFEYKIN